MFNNAFLVENHSAHHWIGKSFGAPEKTTQYYGLLNGPVFYVPLILSSLVASSVSETFQRKYIMNLSIMIWSALIVATAFAQTFLTHIVLRAGTGLFMGFFVPPAISLIVDYFPVNK